MPKLVYKLLFAIIVLASCSESRTLQEAEALLETDPQKADSILTSMAIPKRAKDHALYAVLKTQADYKQYKPITSDSLILTATEYYGTRHKSKHAAMAWYTQGCVYNELNNDLAAIDAYLKAKDLFPDTLIRYFVLTEQKLGRCFLSKGMYQDSYNLFMLCRNNANRLIDSTIIAYSDYHLALIQLHNSKYDGLNQSFINLSTNKHLSQYYRNESLVQLAKYHIFHTCCYDSAFYYLDRKKSVSPNSLGATYNLTGEIYYKLGNLDSSYHYFLLSLGQSTDIYTQCESYRRLNELSLLLGNNQNAFNYGKTYNECLDSIRVLRNANDIAAISIAHKTEIEAIKKKEFRSRTIIISILILSILAVLLYAFYQSHVNKIHSHYIKFCDSVWGKINTKIPQGSTDADYLTIGKSRYLNSPSHSILFSDINNQELKRDEKEAIKHDISIAFSDYLVHMFDKYPSINNKEILLCILSYLGIDKTLICEVLDLSDDNYRKLKSRLKDKIDSSYELYFR